MKEDQKRELELQLRRLLESAGQSPKNSPSRRSTRSGGIRVIRRRSGKPDHHILESQNRDGLLAAIKKSA